MSGGEGTASSSPFHHPAPPAAAADAASAAAGDAVHHPAVADEASVQTTAVSDSSTETAPMVMRMRLTWTLIAMNVAVYLYTNGLSDTARDPSLVDAGAMWGPGVAQGQWWRIFTSAFLHENVVHIGMNMIALSQVGAIVETMLGSRRMLIAYVFSMLTSALAQYLFTFNEPSIGASGAIFGLFGTIVAIGLRLGREGRVLVRQVLPVILINLAIGFAIPNISQSAHVGGLVGGFVVGFLLLAIGQLRAVPATRTKP